MGTFSDLRLTFILAVCVLSAAGQNCTKVNGEPAAGKKLFPLWPADRAAMDAGKVRTLYRTVIKPWNIKKLPRFGNSSKCDAGQMDAAWLSGMEGFLNAYRRLAGAPDAKFLPALNARAAQSSLIMSANGWIDHYPAKTWRCYNDVGAHAASKSSLSLGDDSAIGDWVDDNGVDGVGHRLPTIHPAIRTMGLGAVGGAASLFYGEEEKLTQSHIAVWPPAGYVPDDFAFHYKSFSFSLTAALGPNDTLDWYDADVKVKINNWPRPAARYKGNPWNSFVFEVGYGDKTRLKESMEKGIAIDVTISPVIVNGKRTEIRYRTVYFDANSDVLPTTPMTEPGFYSIE